MKSRDKIEQFFKTANPSWWNPDCAHDNRFWLFKAQSDYIREKLKFHVHPNRANKALDAGCGRGIHSRLLAEMGYSVTSLDINTEMLGLTSKVCNSTLVQGSLEDMPFKSKTFNVVVSVGTSMHVSSIGNMMTEIRRVLCDDGVAIVSIANKFSLYVLWTTKINKHLRRHQGRYHRRQFTNRSFRMTAKTCGFEVIDSAGFAFVPPLSLVPGWRMNIINPMMSRFLSKPFDWILGKYLGCGVTFVLRKG